MDADDNDSTNAEEDKDEQMGTIMKAAMDHPVKDIGVNLYDRNTTTPGDLTTDEGRILSGIKALTGSEQVT